MSTLSTDIPALALSGFCKRFGKVAALDDVELTVPKGALTVVLGAAGAGKTTLLRLIAGLDTPNAGAIDIAGRDCLDLEPRDRDVAMIFDNLALYPNKTGFENIANPLRIRGQLPAEIEARVEAVAATLKIAHILHRRPSTMSGGERQRIALGRALVREPALFLLDEPLSSLDAMLRIELRAELKRLQREFGHSFLMTTPDYAEAMAIADTVIMLRKGKVVQIADPQTLYDLPVDRETALFVGAPEINLVPARFSPEAGGRVALAGGVVAAPPTLAGRSDGFDFEAGLRPESIRLVAAGNGPLAGEVTDIEPLGTNAAVGVTTGGIELRLTTTAAALAGLSLGAIVGLTVDTEALLAFDRDSGRRIGSADELLGE